MKVQFTRSQFLNDDFSLNMALQSTQYTVFYVFCPFELFLLSCIFV